MKTFYTRGGVGDAFIFVCRLYKISKELGAIQIEHFTKYDAWKPKIKELYYHLIPGYVETIFPEKIPPDDWINEARRIPITPYPEFKYQTINQFKLPEKFIVLQTVSGMRKNRKLPKRIIKWILNKNVSVILIGKEKDEELNGTIDLRGRTNVREVVSIIKEAEAFYGPQGFLSFVACSQKVPTVVYILSKEDSKAVEGRIERLKEWKRYLVKKKVLK